MGYAIDTDECIDGVLPFTGIEGRGALALGGLCRFVQLVEDAHDDFRQSRGVGDWAETLQGIVRQLFGEEYQEELIELNGLVGELAESISPFHAGEVEFQVIREWFTQSARESRSSTGFLRGQLTFCSMLPMRSIPFRVVCLIGLCDGVFPRNEVHDTFDLMGSDFRPGDRSPRADDRYQFLEALLAARAHLYLSYIGQSIRTNETIPPSVVLTEFLEVLDHGYGAKNIVVRHPLHPFSRKYFQDDGDGKLFSYDHYCCGTAEILRRGEQPAAVWWQGALTAAIDRILLADLLRFYRNPQKYFIRDCLDIRLDIGEELPDDRELFEVSGLDKYYVEEEMVHSELTGKGKPADILKKMRTGGLWPLGTSGRLAFAAKRSEVAGFVERVRGQQMGGRLANLHENGVMLLRFGPLRGRDLLAGWIHHLVLSRLMPSAKTRIVALDRIVGFGDGADGPGLETLLGHFDRGSRAPSPFFVEPAFIYAGQQAGGRSRIPPVDKARQELTRRLEHGYEPEWQLLLGGGGDETLPVVEFERLCREIMCPIWKAANG
jgi:exodeoxyribonuclease V gamma subunit